LFNSASAVDILGGTGTAGDSPGTLAAVWYLNQGSIELSGRNRLGAPTTGSSVLIKSGQTHHELKAVIRNSAGTAIHTTNFNFNRSSDLYIRKVFNTNPQKTNTRFTPTADVETYWLGQTYDQSVRTVITGAASNDVNLACIAGLKKGSYGFHNQNMPYQNGKTGWFVGQDLLTAASTFRVQDQQKLFRLCGLEAGTSTQRQFKVSIEDIKASPNADITPYGTFSVVLRSLKDTDNKVQVVERFSNCNLDPNSPNYIARRIGDMYMEWSDTEGRFKEYGDNPNNSSHIRVVMDPVVDNGAAEPTLLPFGVLGPPRPVGFRLIRAVIGGVVTSSPRHLDSTHSNAAAQSNAYWLSGLGVIPRAAPLATSGLLRTDGQFTGSVQFPSLMMRSSSLDGGLSDKTNAYFGVSTNRSGSTSYDESTVDYLLPIDEALGKDTYDASLSSGTEPSFQFTLDDLTFDNSLKCMNYVSGSRSLGAAAAGSSYTARSGSAALLDLGYNRFTTVFHGGFDGVDITEMEPFNNAKLATGDQYSNYAYNTVHRAITAVSDPEFIEMNLISMPGLKTAGLTKYMTEVCEERGDALAIIDIENDYTPRTESYATDVNRRGSVAQAVSSMKSRLLDTSYGACYYPWVQIRDTRNSSNVWVPPSVVALGTLASSEAASAVWFAPAGFNRGGLTDGSAGVPVITARQRLSRKDRDDLYENNVNPIAKFPNEGLVIFGQKTLQASPSALDRVNVRRLMIFLKKEISRVATQVLFDQNVEQTWLRFRGLVDPILAATKAQFGLTEYRLILDETTTTPDLIDQNILYAKILLKPARAIEYIAIDFNIMPTGASFDD
jgi:hypothetical protein